MKTDNKIFLIIFLITVSVFGCKNSPLRERLVKIDSLLYKDCNDSAMAILNQTVPEELAATEDLAYYHLLKTQTYYKLYLPKPDDADIDFSIDFYQKTNDKEKLARSYFYKGVTEEEKGDIKNAILNLKAAEHLAKDLDNDELNHKILLIISSINIRNKEFRTGIEYAKKSLEISLKCDNNLWTANNYNKIGLGYSALEQMDSARYYMEKIIPLIKEIPKRDQSTLLNNIYSTSSEEDEEYMVKFLKMSYEIDSNSMACSNLARYYFKKGMKEKSDSMWAQALKDTLLDNRIKFTKGLIRQREAEGDYKEASRLSKELLALTDSQRVIMQKNDIKALQNEYDRQAEMQEAESTRQILSLGLIITILATITTATYLNHRSNKIRTRLAKEQIKAVEYKKELERLEASGSSDKKSIEQLKEQLTRIEGRHEEARARGQKLYEKIKNGENTVTWRKQDFTDYVDYYWNIDPDFASNLWLNYDNLSPKYQFFLTLQNDQMCEEQIMQVMAISESSLRSIKTRVKAKKRL